MNAVGLAIAVALCSSDGLPLGRPCRRRPGPRPRRAGDSAQRRARILQESPRYLHRREHGHRHELERNVYIFHRATRRDCSSTRRGAFVREIGRNNYGFAFAHSVRVDAQDNIWAVDEGTDMLVKFRPDGTRADDHRPSRGSGGHAGEHAGHAAFHGRNESTSSADRPTSPSISRATSSCPTATSMRGW